MTGIAHIQLDDSDSPQDPLPAGPSGLPRLPMKSSPLTVAAAIATILIIVIAFLSPILAPHTPFDPATLSLSDGLKPPVLISPDGDWTFPLGTDDQGRDNTITRPDTRCSFNQPVSAVN